MSGIFGLLGAIGFFRPIDDALLIGRNSLQKIHASGDIIVAAVDEKSLAELGRWPWSRTRFAELINELGRAGSGPIFFDIDLSPRSDEAGDQALQTAFETASKRVTVATSFRIDSVQGRVELLPLDRFVPAIDMANINFRFSGSGQVWDAPTSIEIAGRRHPTFSVAMAKAQMPKGDFFPIDYRIDPRTVPTISAADILAGRVPSSQLAGKTVIFGATATVLGDIVVAPGYGPIPGPYMHVLGAETLRRGALIYWGFLPAFVGAMLVALALAAVRSRRLFLTLFLSGIAGLAIIPFPLINMLILVDVVPAFALLSLVGGRFVWIDVRARYRQRALVNPISGLPNLEALRVATDARTSVIIVMRVLNLAQVTSALPPEREKALVEQIARRLGAGGASTAYQGDEGLFALLHAETEGQELADHLSALQTMFRSPVMLGDVQLDLSITLGVDRAFDRPAANRLSSALVAADEAAAEGVDWKCHDPSKLEDSAWRLSLLSQLESAIDRNDLWVAYQPKYDIATRSIIGAEALARWTHPDKGPIRPDVFIAAAEQSNRIERLTLHVLDRAVEAASIIHRRGRAFEVAVNLSAKLLESRAIVTQVRAVLEKYGFPASSLTLELTETAALGTDDRHLDTLHALRDLGVGLSIDDYGTGMSTLGYLKRVPATEIKIDRSFVSALDGQENDRLLVNSTIQLAHSLGLKVVAEGVEKVEALDILARMDCDVAQGYLLSHPLPFNVLLTKLHLQSKRSAA